MARRLGALAAVAAAFEVGELSYSKVRAITRVATATNEELLVDQARCMTASHLERVVRSYRQVTDPAGRTTSDDAEEQYRGRFLSTEWSDDGCLLIRGKLPPAEGAMVMAALRRAATVLYRDRYRSEPNGETTVPGDVSAEAIGHLAQPAPL